MTLSLYKHLIRNLPYLDQSFDIKLKNWKNRLQKELDLSVFENSTNGIISISRNDLLNSKYKTQELILRTLMWGYPTGGRGNNIKTLLEAKNLGRLEDKIEEFSDKEITQEILEKANKDLKGMGISTFSKLLYFSKIKIEGNDAMILDNRIVRVIQNNRFKELESLGMIKEHNKLKYYTDYLKKLHLLSTNLECKPDQLELFLFIFGNNLKSS